MEVQVVVEQTEQMQLEDLVILLLFHLHKETMVVMD